MDVEESEDLRQLHNRVNQELSQRFGDTQADFDGADYHFHMTVMMGGQPLAVYRRFLEELPSQKIHLRFIVRNLGMFVYDEPRGPEGEYMSYKAVAIGT